MDSLYIVMQAYNEEKNIRKVVQAWYPLLEGRSEVSRLVIADSRSRRHINTSKIAKNVFTVGDIGGF